MRIRTSSHIPIVHSMIRPVSGAPHIGLQESVAEARNPPALGRLPFPVPTLSELLEEWVRHRVLVSKEKAHSES